MSNDDDESDKSFDPTPQKLLEARRKGDIAKSVDLQTAAGYAGLTLAFLALGAQSIQAFGTHLQVLIDQADSISVLIFEGGGQASMGGVFWNTALAISPIFLLPALAVLSAILAQRAFVVAQANCSRNCRGYQFCRMLSKNLVAAVSLNLVKVLQNY